MAAKRKVRRKKSSTRRPRVIPADKEVLNAQEAAIVLGVSERLILKLARDGEIPGRKLGREWRFLRSALRNCIAGNGSDDDLEKALNKAGVKFSVKK